MNIPDTESGAGMDTSEALVRERFEAAVAGVQLDVARLVAGGASAGGRLQRRRRLQQGSAAVVGIAVFGTLGVVGVEGALSNGSGGPASGGPSTQQPTRGPLVPATPRALAAAVIAALPADADVRTITASGSFARSNLQVVITFTTEGSTVELTVGATRPLGSNVGIACDQPATLRSCGDVTLPNGKRVFSSLYDNGEASEGGLILGVYVTERAVSISESVIGVTSVDELPLSRAALAAIGFDRLVGARTSQAMIDAGQALRNVEVVGEHRSGSTITSTPGPKPTTTPQSTPPQ